jgi:hypothetical protein
MAAFHRCSRCTRDFSSSAGACKHVVTIGGGTKTLGLKVVLEENPKWDLLREVLHEVSTDARTLPEEEVVEADVVEGAVALVVCKDDATVKLLRDYIGQEQKGMLQREMKRYVHVCLAVASTLSYGVQNMTHGT